MSKERITTVLALTVGPPLLLRFVIDGEAFEVAATSWILFACFFWLVGVAVTWGIEP